MKHNILIGVTGLLLSFAIGTYADERPRSLQEALEVKIEEMETLVAEMEGESDGWTLRSTMQTHAKLMDASASLATAIAEAEFGEEECVKGPGAKGDSDICYVPEAQHNAQFKLLVVLMRHVIRRQNIIMEKTGIFK